jgi:hypothetical protein
VKRNTQLGPLLRNKQQMAAYWVKIRAFGIVARGRICCDECGDRRWDVLHCDHINNDGHNHRKKIGKGGVGAGKRVYHWIIQHPAQARKMFRLLCANCHLLKTIYGYVPRDVGDMTEKNARAALEQDQIERWEYEEYVASLNAHRSPRRTRSQQ